MGKGSKREATFAATRRLRDEHPGRFRALLAEELEKRGFEVPATREEKAREQVEKLLRDYPQVVHEAVGYVRDHGAGTDG